MSDLILLRHGETAGQSSIRYYGATDIGLSEIGEQQMVRSCEALKGIVFRDVVVSPMIRSRESAALALNGNGVHEIVVEEFLEINFGDWEGLTIQEIAERDPDLHSEWIEHGRLDRFPGGDSRTEFFDRVKKAASRVFNNLESPALAVLHKGVIKGILSELLEIPMKDLLGHSIELGSIHRLKKTPAGWSLVGDNETGHLGEYRIEHS